MLNFIFASGHVDPFKADSNERRFFVIPQTKRNNMRLTNLLRDSFVRAAMDDVPQIDYQEKIIKTVIDEAVRQLPPKIRAIYQDKTLCHYVATKSRYFGNQYVTYPGEELKLSDEAKSAVNHFKELDNVQDETRGSLQTKLHAVAYSCTTRKALLDALPEFEKYLPADDAEACRTLPVVANVVSEFVKAGWPKGVARKKNK